MDFSEMGKRIRQKRMSKSLTQEELAEKIGVTPAYIGMIERGERAPSLDSFVLLVNELDTTADELLTEVVNNSYDARLARYFDKIATMKGADIERLFRIMNIFLCLDEE